MDTFNNTIYQNNNQVAQFEAKLFPLQILVLQLNTAVWRSTQACVPIHIFHISPILLANAYFHNLLNLTPTHNKISK